LSFTNRHKLKKGHQQRTNSPSQNPRIISIWVLLKVALRSLLLEAAWNAQGQQNIGFLASLDPALKALYRDKPDQLKAARLRALNFFNTNPIASGLVIGAAIKLEEELANGFYTEKRLNTMKSALGSALASQGDRFFWQSWLPLCCLLTILATFWVNWIYTPLLIPVLFASLALPIRLGGLFLGYRLGHQVHTVVNRFSINSTIARLQILLVIALALFTASVLWTAPAILNSQPWRVLAVSLIFFSIVRLYRRLCLIGQQWLVYLFYPVVLAALAFSTLIL
jgi:mannose/fructose/N-acetylgalactosamine-specific phosphotransferase system component IID